jgi:hypothetical protein
MAKHCKKEKELRCRENGENIEGERRRGRKKERGKCEGEGDRAGKRRVQMRAVIGRGVWCWRFSNTRMR